MTSFRLGCLDPEDQPRLAVRHNDGVVLVLVDEPHERGCGRSSSAAKKAEAVFKIAFARRNSRFSFSSRTSRARSPDEMPGRAPASIWPCLTQPRNVSRSTPNCSPTRAQAEVTLSASSGSSSKSATSRTARSRISSGYFLGAATALILQGVESPHQSRCGPKNIRRGSFPSVPDLIASIENYRKASNANPKPLTWTATAESILQKVRRGRVALNQSARGLLVRGSQAKTSVRWLVSPRIRSDASELNAMCLPWAEVEGNSLLSLSSR